jgi:CubicO group peptidase (beta-lactamase class C family)
MSRATRLFQTIAVFLAMVTLSLRAEELRLDHPDAQAAGMNPEALARIPRRLQDYVDKGTTAGIVVMLARHRVLASVEAIGHQDIEKEIPMSKETMFRIASLTKPVTCAGIMILVDEGRISLIDPAEKYLPEYKGLKLNPCGAKSGYYCTGISPARPISIQDLMTHMSGLPASVEAGQGPPPKTLAEHVALGAKLHLLFEPGADWNYSNIGIDILGRIIEVVSGRAFDQFLQERIFAPLGMNDTYFSVPVEKRARVATLYSFTSGSPKAEPAYWGEPHAPFFPEPAGGLVSTAPDMLRFNLMMLGKGKLAGRRVLSAAAVELMTTSHTGDLKAGWSPGLGHGFGYEVVRSTEGMFRYSSIGTFVKGGAYRTYEFVDPQKDLAGVFMMQRNSGAGDTTDELNSFIEMSAAAIDR